MAKGSTSKMEGPVWLFVSMIVVVFLLGAISFAAFSRLQGADDIPFDPDAKGYDQCNINVGIKGMGSFRDSPADTVKRGEVFTQSVIYFSGEPGGLSQEIVASASGEKCGTGSFPNWPIDMRYIFQINTGGGFELFYQDDTRANGRIDLELPEPGGPIFGTVSFKIDGNSFCTVSYSANGLCPEDKESDIVDGSVLRVNVWGRARTILFNTYVLFARDEVKLRDATAFVDFNKEGYTIPTDKVAVVSWRAPTATYQDCDRDGNCVDKPAYFIEVTNLNPSSNQTVFAKTPIPSKQGSIIINLTEDMVSNDITTCRNQLKATLYTAIAEIDEDFTSIRTIEMAKSAPTVKNIKLSSTDIREGDTVTVTWEVEGNVTNFIVTIYIGGAKVFDNANVDPKERSLSFQASQSGFGSVWIAPVDKCATGDTVQTNFFVGNVGPKRCVLFPELCDPDWIATLVLALFVIGLAILLIVLFWFLSKVLKESPGLAFLISLGITAAVAVALLLSGTLDWAINNAGILG